jgi:hypothetical protein
VSNILLLCYGCHKVNPEQGARRVYLDWLMDRRRVRNGLYLTLIQHARGRDRESADEDEVRESLDWVFRTLYGTLWGVPPCDIGRRDLPPIPATALLPGPMQPSGAVERPAELAEPFPGDGSDEQRAGGYLCGCHVVVPGEGRGHCGYCARNPVQPW